MTNDLQIWVYQKNNPNSAKNYTEEITEALKRQIHDERSKAKKLDENRIKLVGHLIKILKTSENTNNVLKEWFDYILKASNKLSRLVDKIILDFLSHSDVHQDEIKKFRDFVFENYPRTRILLYKIFNHPNEKIKNNFFYNAGKLSAQQTDAILDCTDEPKDLYTAKAKINLLIDLGADETSIKSSLMNRINNVKANFKRNIDEQILLNKADEDDNDLGIMLMDDTSSARKRIYAELRGIKPKLTANILLFYALVKKQLGQNLRDTRPLSELFKTFHFESNKDEPRGGGFNMKEFLDPKIISLIIRNLNKIYKNNQTILNPSLVTAIDKFIRAHYHPLNELDFSRHIMIFFETIKKLDPKKAQELAIFILQREMSADSIKTINVNINPNFKESLINILDTADTKARDFFVRSINEIDTDNEKYDFIYKNLCRVLENVFCKKKQSNLFINIIKDPSVDFDKLMDFIYRECIDGIRLFSEDALGDYIHLQTFQKKLTYYYATHESQIPRLELLDPNGQLKPWLKSFLPNDFQD